MSVFLFPQLPKILKKIKNSKKVLLLFDYDGTLTPIKPTPGLARLQRSIKTLLKHLAGKNRFLLGIISGRALADVKKKVALAGIIYVGNHGFEIEYKGKYFCYALPKKTVAALSNLSKLLKRTFAQVKGTLIEDKILSLSLHYRRVRPQAVPRVKKIIYGLRKEYNKKKLIKFTNGKKVIEIKPKVAWDKGKAILWLIKKLRLKRPLLIFAGDDITDEDAFRVVNARKGISVVVGKKRDSSARYYVNNPSELKVLLSRLKEHA